ncbi:MAG TPA: glycosyltransferase family 39 protein [Roseiflexaceae bacterium]|nr:glycosyltransferase family 39 protein [Roseiflexaceae bacterium]
MAARPASLARRLASFGIFLATLLLYLGTLTQVHTFDALSYVTSVERKPWTEVFHPHHLAYGPLGLLAQVIGEVLGADGAALPMQVVNALAGALGVALFFSLVRRATGRADLALAAALLLGGGYAYWYYAVEIEVYTVATLLLIACLRLMPRLLERPTTRDAALLGLAQGGAVLFHQTNMLLCAPVLLVLLAAKNGEPRTEEHGNAKTQRRKDAKETGFFALHALGVKTHSTTQNSKLLLSYGLVLALVVGLPYLAVGLGVSGFRSWDAFAGWLLEYARTGWWGGPITASTWERLGEGLAETLAQPAGGPLWLLLIGLLVLRLRALAAGRGRLVLALALWLLVYAAFFTWWEPDNIEFWIASMPPALLLLALALRGTPRWGPEVWVALAVGLCGLGLNHDAIVRRGDPARDLQRLVADAVGAQLRPADLALVADELQELYLPYYQRHDNFLSINQAMFEHGGDWGPACDALRERAEAALHAGAAVVVAEAVLRPPAPQLERHRLVQAQIDACFAPYRSLLQPLALPPGAPPHWRLPAARELAEGPGWRFDAGPQGWRAANLASQRFEDGWRAVPASDPSLLSPLLDIDADGYQAIEIRMASASGARDAQLFFASPDGALDEARSLRWSLAETDAPTTYRLELRDAPGWQGRIARLRIDPVGVGDGGALLVEWVRLVR